jgi:hypothetical protein
MRRCREWVAGAWGPCAPSSSAQSAAAPACAFPLAWPHAAALANSRRFWPARTAASMALARSRPGCPAQRDSNITPPSGCATATGSLDHSSSEGRLPCLLGPRPSGRTSSAKGAAVGTYQEVPPAACVPSTCNGSSALGGAASLVCPLRASHAKVAPYKRQTTVPSATSATGQGPTRRRLQLVWSLPWGRRAVVLRGAPSTALSLRQDCCYLSACFLVVLRTLVPRSFWTGGPSNPTVQTLHFRK